MDYRGVTKCNKVKKQRKRSDDHNSKKSNIKVVYISTPMKVKTSASRFRALVQELTGQDSDIVRIMESNGATEFEDYNGRDNNELHELLPAAAKSFNELHDELLPAAKTLSQSPSLSSSSSLLQAKSNSSSVSSESNYFTEPNFEELLFSRQMEEQFLALLESANSEIDVLGSYDAL